MQGERLHMSHVVEGQFYIQLSPTSNDCQFGNPKTKAHVLFQFQEFKLKTMNGKLAQQKFTIK